MKLGGEFNILNTKTELLTLNKISDLDQFKAFFNSLPYSAAIIDPDRKVVFANTSLLQNLGYANFEEILGHRPGEILKCLHAHENNNICGTSSQCKLCSTLSSIKQTQTELISISSEMRLVSKSELYPTSADLRVTTTPLLIGDKTYTIIYLFDISHEKRRKALERIFFHDILNKISGLNGYFELIAREVRADKIKEFFGAAHALLADLTDEILAQRQIAAAENDELVVKKNELELIPFIERLTEQIKLFEVSYKTTLCTNINIEHGYKINTDPVILNRIITNMLKNAFEACYKCDTITISAESKEQKLRISVHNPGVIPLNTQLQIFKRSFSTKGEGRGLGTYSIKLLTEKYLNGKVGLISTEENGTTFYIELNE